MYRGKKILGLIPARGGSKGLPRKNIKSLLGKPLIAWTIETAKKSKYIDRIIVSTENREIAEISKKYGAEVPFIRPKELATDGAKGIKVVLHALNQIIEKGDTDNLIMLLQPTSPLRLYKDIDGAIELLFKKNAQAVISVCKAEHHPYWSNVLPPSGCLSNFRKWPESANKSRQELPIFYRVNGAIYLAYYSFIKKAKDFIGKDTFAYIMPQDRSVDIDTGLDFLLAESLLNKRKK